MNPTIKSILSRRSKRAYKKDQVSDADLDTILQAGLHAATARNLQPWHFTVIQNQQVIRKIDEAAKKTIRQSNDTSYLSRVDDPGFTLFFHAPTVIIVSGDTKAPYAMTDCANATQNICVAAHSLGLGSCYIASFIRAFQDTDTAISLKKELGIPDTHTPRFAVSLGYTDGDMPEIKIRRQDVINHIR